MRNSKFYAFQRQHDIVLQKTQPETCICLSIATIVNDMFTNVHVRELEKDEYCQAVQCDSAIWSLVSLLVPDFVFS